MPSDVLAVTWYEPSHQKSPIQMLRVAWLPMCTAMVLETAVVVDAHAEFQYVP
jgi:hypothetical protein